MLLDLYRRELLRTLLYISPCFISGTLFSFAARRRRSISNIVSLRTPCKGTSNLRRGEGSAGQGHDGLIHLSDADAKTGMHSVRKVRTEEKTNTDAAAQEFQFATDEPKTK